MKKSYVIALMRHLGTLVLSVVIDKLLTNLSLQVQQEHQDQDQQQCHHNQVQQDQQDHPEQLPVHQDHQDQVWHDHDQHKDHQVQHLRSNRELDKFKSQSFGEE